jgi:hypothetical protein
VQVSCCGSSLCGNECGFQDATVNFLGIAELQLGLDLLLNKLEGMQVGHYMHQVPLLLVHCLFSVTAAAAAAATTAAAATVILTAM